MKRAFLCALFVFFPTSYLEASDKNEIEALRSDVRKLTEMVEKLSGTVAAQERTIQELRTRTGTPAPVAADASGSPRALVSGTRPYLPEIGVVADIVATSTENPEDEEGNDRIAVREVEFLFGHDVDPYTRLDVNLAISDFEEARIEEAYLTLLDLPFETTGRFGRFKPKFGKILSRHRDSIESVDEPLVIQRFFGIEGLSKTGAELSAFLPPLDDRLTQQFNLGLLEGGNGEDSETFSEARRRPALYARTSNFVEIGDRSSADVGLNYMTGSSDDDSSFDVDIFAIDLTFLHELTARQRLKFSNEFFLQARERSELRDDSSTAQGFYSLVDYRFQDRWSTGLRFDYVEALALEDYVPSQEIAMSAWLTFYQSEFARWRLQYQYFDEAEDHDNRVFLQGVFAIGTHKHQIQ